MTAATQYRELSHPAARATHAVYEATRIAADVSAHPMSCGRGAAIADLMEEVAADVAALYQDTVTKDEQLADLREEACRMAQYIVRLENADSTKMQAIIDLKTRLARAAEENEALYRLTNHEVGDATVRHMAVTRIRDLLDLETPLPPRPATRISTPTAFGAPRAAATH